MTSASYLPHIELILQSLRVARDRLDGRGKVAVNPQFLVHAIRQMVKSLPFDEGFYLTTYDDVAQAHGIGEIGDLHSHFIEVGFFEGRLGAEPDVDSEYYLKTYPDVGRAIAGGLIGSASEHYIYHGIVEGRAPNAGTVPEIIRWMTALRPDG